MAYKFTGNVVVDNDRGGSFSNVTVTTEAGTGASIYGIGIGVPSTGFQGTVAGVFSGGRTPGALTTNTIQYFPFATDGNTTDAGDLTFATAGQNGGCSSDTDGFSTQKGGNAISRFPFASYSSSVDHGDKFYSNPTIPGVASSSRTHGYLSGGTTATPPLLYNIIQKYPFSSTSGSKDVGRLTVTRYNNGGGHSSSEHGYVSGGVTDPPVMLNNIDKFPFATDSNASDVGDLATTGYYFGSCSSYEHGYRAGGNTKGPNVNVNTIERFPFTTDSNASDVGDLSSTRAWTAGIQSETFGYLAGSYESPTIPRSNEIQKFPFASSTTSTDSGDLLNVTQEVMGHQH